MTAKSMDQLVALAKRRGFIFQSNEIYGGLQGVYDYGPLGVELKNNLKNIWWSSMVYERDDIEGIDASILTHSDVLKFSGHEETFTDPLIDCRSCKFRCRADQLVDGKCPNCGSDDLTEPRPFNLMFKTSVGPLVGEDNFVYLRPETAQHIFTNFKNILDSCPKPLPFGIAQIGKAFRNEITPRNFIFRVREFEQMELEYFVHPSDDKKYFDEWVKRRFQWWVDIGINKNNLELYNVPEKELSHYSKSTTDIMYKFPHGVEELEGIANRTDFDLGSHTKNQNDYSLSATVRTNDKSNSKLSVNDLNSKKWFIPYVIEPSAGVDRGFLAILNEAYTEEKLDNDDVRIVLKFKPSLAPVKVAVIPLKKNNHDIVALSNEIKTTLQSLRLGRVLIENTGNIGKSYRKHDEIGTPVCVTVDFDSLEKGVVTLRDRDTMKQITKPITELSKYIKSLINSS